jgi:hypothetical protein
MTGSSNGNGDFKMSQLLINNRTITLGSTIYQIRNITSIGKYKIKPSYFFSITAILVCFGAAILCAQANTSLNRLAAIAGLLGVIGILERFLRKTRYGLSLETNASSSRLVVSEDQGFIDTIISKMHQVLQDQETPANYTFNVAQGDIINQEGIFENGVRI